MEVKKVVIAGSRTYTDYESAKAFIDTCIKDIRKNNKIIIVSGGSRGADKIGEKYAEDNGFQVELFLPEWNKYGRGAGPKRNEQMVQESDLIICFWDGKSSGTKSLIGYAEKHNKNPFVKEI